MKQDLLVYLRCPACLSGLELVNAHVKEDRVVCGNLRCNRCGERYPISEQGVPRLLPPALLRETADSEVDFARKRKEMVSRDAQVHAYDRLPGLQLLGRLEIPQALKYAEVKKHHYLLEGGCGNGRMTRAFAQASQRVFAVDFSLESLHVNQARLKDAGVRNVDLVQADLSYLPFADDMADAVISCQVIEHVPSHAARVGAIRGFGRVAKRDARVAISGYKYNLFERLFGAKEGEHDGNIPFFRFTRDEFRSLLEEALEVERIDGKYVYCWTAKCIADKRAGTLPKRIEMSVGTRA